jgi:hypothetical protein
MVCARRGIEACQNLFQENLLGLGYVDGRLSRESILRLRNHLVDNFLLCIPSGRDKINRKANWGAGRWKPKEDLNPSRAQLDELLRRQKIFFSYLTCTQKIEICPSPALCWLDRKDPLGVSLPLITYLNTVGMVDFVGLQKINYRLLKTFAKK